MLNLRCLYCQTPFTIGRAEMLNALISMDERNQNHHDAHCPRCRRANSISRQRMELFFPNWREAAKQLPALPKEEAPASAAVKTEPLPRSLKNAVVKSAASEKASAVTAKVSASKRKRASKPSSATKTTPAPKGAPSKAKKPASKPLSKSPASKPGTKKK